MANEIRFLFTMLAHIAHLHKQRIAHTYQRAQTIRRNALANAVAAGETP